MPAASGASGPTIVSAIGSFVANVTRSAIVAPGTLVSSGLARRAAVARRHEHLRDARRLRDLPRQRMFASAAADDEDVHASPVSLIQSRITRPKT